MRTVPIHHVATVGNAVENIRGRIEASATAHIMDTIANLYERPEEAFVRELSTNARDAMIEAGRADQPILVKLPTSEDPNFTVHDYGTGLSIEELRDIYLSYGASTKRESDDFNGTLGFGSKSPLAYAPLGYQIAAVRDGRKVLAVIMRDSDGVAVMRVLHEGPTTEHNGVTITIPVEHHDIAKVNEAAARVYKNFDEGSVLYVYVDDDDPTKIGFEAPETWVDDESVIWLDDDRYLGVRKGDYGVHSVVIMGNVGYKLDRRSSWGFAVIARVPMGSVHFTPSREALMFTDHTNATVADVFDYVDAQAIHVLAEQVRGAGVSYWDRLEAFIRVSSNLSNDHKNRLRSLLIDVLPTSMQYSLPEGKHGYSYWPNRSRGNSSTWQTLRHSSVFDNRVGIVVNYDSQAAKLAARTKEHLNRWNNTVWERRQVDPELGWSVTTWMLLPKGVDVTNVEFLDGYAQVIDWEQLKELTPRPAGERGPRGPREATRYPVWQAGVVQHLTLDEIDLADGPIVWEYEETSRYGTSGYNSNGGAYWTTRHPEIQLVVIKPASYDKVTKAFPMALSVRRYNDRIVEQVRKSLTPADTFRMNVGFEWDWLKGADVHDPEVRRLVALAHSTPSQRQLRAQRLGISANHRGTELRDFHDRYPIVRRLANYGGRVDGELVEEAILYMNAKYAATVADEVVEEAEAIVRESASA